jgi:hypothetical protein
MRKRKTDRAMVRALNFRKYIGIPDRCGEIVRNHKIIYPPTNITGSGTCPVRPP